MKDNTKRITVLDALIKEQYDQLQKLDEQPLDKNETFDEYMDKRNPYNKKINAYDRERRLLMTPEFKELSDYGDVMPLKSFIDAVRSGGFIDYDGYGNYVRDGKESNITIYPSDVDHKSIRPDFDTIVWFNK